MRLLRFAILANLFLLASQGFAAPSGGSSADVVNKLPLRFEASAKNRWVAHGLGFAIGFNQDATFMDLGDRGVRLTLDGSNRLAPFQGARKSATPTNYFGVDARTAESFLRLRRTGVYPGIDIVYYGKGQALEYDFELAPGADPSLIRMNFDGADSVSLSSSGEVILRLGDRDVTQRAPVVYQRRASGEIVAVESSYRTEEGGSIGIALGNYNRDEALVIDPNVLFTAFLAGRGADVPAGIGQDKNGSIYIAGYTQSPDFPLVGTAYTGFFTNAGRHVFTTKLNPLKTGDDVITYSGFFSGPFGSDLKAMAVDSEGVLYLAGVTIDFFFPVTANAFLTSNGGVSRSFISVIDTKLPGMDGLTYSTFFAGTEDDEPTAIAVAGGKIYVTGFTDSPDFPVVSGAFQPTRISTLGTFDSFVSEIDPSISGTAGLVASTFLGGTDLDVARSIAVAPDGQVYVAGYTYSTDFPTTTGSYRPFYGSGGEAFLCRLDLSAGKLTYSTFFGGSDQDQAKKILIDPKGRVAITGYTLSDDFPVTPDAVQPTPGGNGDAFLTVLDPNAEDFTKALIYSTYFGGSDGEVAYDLRRDDSGKYYLVGYTLSTDLPIRNGLVSSPVLGGSATAFVAVIDPAAASADALTYSSYITGPGTSIAYGVEVDSLGNIYVTGAAIGTVFTPNQAKPPARSNYNVFLLVFHP